VYLWHRYRVTPYHYYVKQMSFSYQKTTIVNIINWGRKGNIGNSHWICLGRYSLKLLRECVLKSRVLNIKGIKGIQGSHLITGYLIYTDSIANLASKYMIRNEISCLLEARILYQYEILKHRLILHIPWV